MSIELETSAIQVWCLSNWAILAFDGKSETLISLYDQSLFDLTKSSEYKNQAVYEQKTV